mgnify:CR=1 FL=1
MNKYIIDDGRRDRIDVNIYINIYWSIYIYTDNKRYTKIKKTVAVFVFVDISIVDYKKNKIIFYSKLKNDENYGKFKK